MSSWTTKDLQERGFTVENGKAVRPTAVRTGLLNRKIYTFLVSPCPKPRMTRSDKWNKRPCVIRYREFCDKLRHEALTNGFQLPDADFTITFYLPIPKIHLKREKEGMPHQEKPDSDNLLKAVFDALLKQDKTIYRYSVAKYYSSQPRIEITLK